LFILLVYVTEPRSTSHVVQLNDKLFGRQYNTDSVQNDDGSNEQMAKIRRQKEYELKRMDSASGVNGDSNWDTEGHTSFGSSRNVTAVDQTELSRKNSVVRRMSVQCSSSMLYLPPSALAINEEDDVGKTSRQSYLERFVDSSGVNLLSEPIFFIPFLANLFAMTGLYIPFYFITSRAMTLGVDQTWAAFLISIIG